MGNRAMGDLHCSTVSDCFGFATHRPVGVFNYVVLWVGHHCANNCLLCPSKAVDSTTLHLCIAACSCQVSRRALSCPALALALQVAMALCTGVCWTACLWL